MVSGVPKHDPNFFTQLVDKDSNGLCLINMKLQVYASLVLIIRACKPNVDYPRYHHRFPHVGTKAATESITTKSTAPDVNQFTSNFKSLFTMSLVVTSRSSSILTPSAAAYAGSKRMLSIDKGCNSTFFLNLLQRHEERLLFYQKILVRRFQRYVL